MPFRSVLLVTLVVLIVGCTQNPKPNPPAIPEVRVALPTTRTITDVEEFTGWTRAVKTVEVRARVTGYLDQVLFKDGDEVGKGDRLFVIDPRTYKAEADKAEAALRQTEATLERLTNDLKRGRAMLAGRAISIEELDRLTGNRAEADAAVRAARAALDSTQLNLNFTQVTSPIAGRLSRRMVDQGNLVKADDTLLTTVVALDPIHAYFDIDERTVLTLRRMIQKKEMTSARVSPIRVKIGLADEMGFSLEGDLDFVDNQLDHGTGTLRVRATVANKPLNDVHTLSPNMFVRVQLPIGPPRQALLIAESALGSDQGNKIVYVLGSDNKVVQKRVELGQQEGDMRVIKKGLESSDRVIVAGMQRVRSGNEARVKE